MRLGIPAIADPLAGSFAIESLTDQLYERARKIIDEIEALGGMTKAIESGMPKLKIEECAANRQVGCVVCIVCFVCRVISARALVNFCCSRLGSFMWTL